MLENGFSIFRDKRVLLLQGPVGPFFRRLSDDLEQAGARVFKVNFNGGDWLFYSSNSFNYRGTIPDWPEYLEALLDRLLIDIILLFGDCRPIHIPVHEIAHRRGIRIGVFEEGYVRPDYITLERLGVNGHSVIPRSAIFYLNQPPMSIERTLPVGNTFWYATRWAVMYYFAAGLLKPFFRHYRHHRPLSWQEAFPWLRSAWRKAYYRVKEAGISARLKDAYSGRFFLVPLQVHNDFQIQTHSEFDSVAQFIDRVMTSFAGHAPKRTVLVIKHHPMDRGYFDYAKLIARRSGELGLENRCFYIHDQHLPTLLKRARGVAVVNSTVGLSALLHGTPVKVCGKALYNIKGLTFQGTLDEFWHEAPGAKPERNLFERFYAYLVQHTQLNGSFYKPLPFSLSASGIRWTSKTNYVSAHQQEEVENKLRRNN